MSFAIIGGEIHTLKKISPNTDWTEYAWRIKYKDEPCLDPIKDRKVRLKGIKNLYWVPVENLHRNPNL